MGEIGQEDGNPVSRFYAVGDEEICHPVSSLFHLRKGARRSFKDGVGVVGIALRSLI